MSGCTLVQPRDPMLTFEGPTRTKEPHHLRHPPTPTISHTQKLRAYAHASARGGASSIPLLFSYLTFYFLLMRTIWSVGFLQVIGYAFGNVNTLLFFFLFGAGSGG